MTAKAPITPPPGAVTAIQITSESDWHALVAWTGGDLLCEQVAAGEFEFRLALPDGTVAVAGDWIAKSDDGVKLATVATAPPAWFPETLEGMLRELHSHFGLHRGLMPGYPNVNVPDDIRDLRIALMLEEFRELNAALLAGDITGIADGIADLIIAAAGTAIPYGLPLDQLIAEVHASNMTKTNDPDAPKLVKGNGYRPPAIDGVLWDAITAEVA